jgi:hypothetical protein
MPGPMTCLHSQHISLLTSKRIDEITLHAAHSTVESIESLALSILSSLTHYGSLATHHCSNMVTIHS